jgi:hypothetical protein
VVEKRSFFGPLGASIGTFRYEEGNESDMVVATDGVAGYRLERCGAGRAQSAVERRWEVVLKLVTMCDGGEEEILISTR